MRLYITNSLWLITEKIVNTVGVLFVTILTARYLGPEKMGVINISLALGAIITPIAQLGSQTLIFDKTSRNNLLGGRLLISTQNLRKLIFILLFFTSIFFCYSFGFFKENNILIFSLVLFSFYFLSLDSYKPYFDACFKSKKNSLATQSGIVVSLIFRFLLVKMGAGLVYFSIPYIINYALPYFIKKEAFRKEYSSSALSDKRKSKYKKYMLATGFPLVIANLSIVLYVKVANLFLASITSTSDVAIYNAAITISQGWVFFPMSILTVLFAKVLNEKDSRLADKGYGFIVLICTLISSFFCVILFAFKNEIILASYGQEYVQAILIVPALSLAALFSIIGTVGYRIIIHHGGYTFLMKKMLSVSMLNIVVTYLLIKAHGILGAAYAILFTEIVSATVFNYFYRKKSLLKIHCGSVFSLSYLRNLK
ncbi:oligosaccharide flippase family protein [Vibrio fluvialis]|nr:oligosaccharide flippase family protein [Vibrio fluvialis]